MKFVPLLPNDDLPEGKSKVVKARSIKVCVYIYIKICHEYWRGAQM